MTTHYQGSRGPMLIAEMPLPYAQNALAKLQRERIDASRDGEIDALAAHVATLSETIAEQAVGLPEVEPPPPMGHNAPPEATPYEAIKIHIDDLVLEAKNWCDGAAIENQDQADTVAKLIEGFRQAFAAADNARKDENKPFDEGKAAVQAKYAPLIADTKTQRGKVVLAIETLKATLAPWLKKLDEEKRAAEAAARQAAEQAAADAAAAMRAADVADLDAREAAETLVAVAHQAETDAKRAAGDRAHAKGIGRAIGLRSYWVATMSEPKAALQHYLKVNPEAIKGFLQQLADQDIQRGLRTIPGFTVTEEKRVA